MTGVLELFLILFLIISKTFLEHDVFLKGSTFLEQCVESVVLELFLFYFRLFITIMTIVFLKLSAILLEIISRTAKEESQNLFSTFIEPASSTSVPEILEKNFRTVQEQAYYNQVDDGCQILEVLWKLFKNNLCSNF